MTTQKKLKNSGCKSTIRNIQYIVFLLLSLSTILTGCKKDVSDPAAQKHDTTAGNPQSFSLKQAQAWYQQQDSPADSVLQSLQPDWSKAKQPKTKRATWIVPLPGSPVFQGIRQGSSHLVLQADSTGAIKAKIIEVIPDAYTLQANRKMDRNRFTGRVLIYDKNYQLQSGRLIVEGKPVGEIKNKSLAPKHLENLREAYTAVLNKDLKMGIIAPHGHHTDNRISVRPAPSEPGANNFYDIPAQTSGLQEVCTWYDSFYIDAYGVFTIHSERICTYVWVDDEEDWDGYYDLPGTGSPSNPNNPVPQPSNLPAEDQPSVNPQKMMECFSAISGPSANYQVKIHVQEPLPGTSFNIGPNSFGHVAIELTVTNAGQSVTQVVGFYPTGTGLDKMISPSRIVNNGNLEYNVSATFYVNPYNFQKITDFISHPPEGYHYLNYNCTAFVYTAATLGGISIPMGYTTVGLSGPGGATVAQTPAGLGSELRSMKANNPYLNISTGGGRARSSKGECN